jgi:hypothetical protein
MTGAPRTRRTRPSGRLASWTLGALLVLGGLAAGCGSKERALVEQVKAQCTALQGKTVLEADQAFSQAGQVVDCRQDLVPAPADQCPGAPAAYTEPVCRLVWAFYPNDPGLCDPRGGCWYGCEGRITSAEADASGNAAILCAVHPFSGAALDLTPPPEGALP